jgi:hypothetical protein
MHARVRVRNVRSIQKGGASESNSLTELKSQQTCKQSKSAKREY